VSPLIWLLIASAAESDAHLPLDGAIVHRPPHVTHREAFGKLPEAVVVVPHAPQDPSALAKAFAEAAKAKAQTLPAGKPVVLLATGPWLDGPDKVAPRRLTRRGGKLDLTIVHTAVRRQGAKLRRNIRWRPMVQVPLDLPAGAYTLEVTWRAVDAVPDGKPLEAPALAHTTRFALAAQPP